MTLPQVAGALSGHQSGPLASIHQALPDLSARLRAAGMVVGPDRWQNLYDLLLALAAQQRLPAQAAGLAPYMAPLLCRSEREQAQFRAAFRQWCEGLPEHLRGAGAPAAVPVLVSARRLWRGLLALVLALVPARRLWRGLLALVLALVPARRLWGGLLALVLLLALGVAGTYWYHFSHRLPESGAPPVGAKSAEPPETASSPRPPEAAPRPASEASVLRPIPPRGPRPPPTLDPVHQTWLATLGDLCPFIPGFFALSWLLLRWLSWRTVLERRLGDPNDSIPLDGLADPLLNAPALREALKRLHGTLAVATRRLNVDATVERTARHAGLFHPVPRQRRRVPDLVVLCETQHAGDQMAGLAAQLTERLRDAGLEAHRYHYRGSPRRVVGEDGRWRALAEVLDRHPGARLLLIGEPAALIEPESVRPQDWTRHLSPWSRRGLLTTRRPPPAWGQALRAAGFAVADLSSAGVQTLALHLAGLGDQGSMVLAETTVPLPSLLQDARRWSQPVSPAPADLSTLLAAVDAYLGADGTRLLATMAAYPQLDWGLTRVLDLSLFPAPAPAPPAGEVPTAEADPDWIGREARLLKIARLPWSRMGWLPTWLRAALLERLDGAALRDIRRRYRALLVARSGDGRGRIVLPVALPEPRGLVAGLWCWVRDRSRRVGAWLRGARAMSDDHGVMNDAIFADVLFGWRLRVLDFVLRRDLLRRHLGGALGRALAPRILLACILALAGAWGADLAWTRWLKSQAEPWLMQHQQGAHANYHIEIGQGPETGPLAEALGATLTAEGFDVRLSSEPFALPPGKDGKPAVGNLVRWGDRADRPMAEHIARRLTYLAWGHAPEVSDALLVGWPDRMASEPLPPRHLRVLLGTPATTGTGFSDPLQRPVTAEEKAQINAIAPPPVERTDPAVVPPASPVDAPAEPVPTEPPIVAPESPGASEISQAQANRITSLESELRKLNEQLQRERDGRSGGLAGYGPEVEALAARTAPLREALRNLQEGDGGAVGTAGPWPPFRDPLTSGGTGPEMITLPGGSFRMGSPRDEPRRRDEGPQHQVNLRPFAMGRTEVTFADYDRFAGATRREKPGDEGWGRGDRPAINVSWSDATAYAQWLSAQTGQPYRLPTEAEWEFATRAQGDPQAPFWTGDCVHTEQANYDGTFDYNGCGAKTGHYRQQTVPAGSLPPNPWGLNEVAGNAWEWVADCWHNSYQGAPNDGSAWGEAGGGDCARRVVRGGSWFDGPSRLRSAARKGFTSDEAYGMLGFRLARTL